MVHLNSGQLHPDPVHHQGPCRWEAWFMFSHTNDPCPHLPHLRASQSLILFSLHAFSHGGSFLYSPKITKAWGGYFLQLFSQPHTDLQKSLEGSISLYSLCPDILPNSRGHMSIFPKNILAMLPLLK